MDKQMKIRLCWIQLYQETGDAGLTCRRCEISRPTLRLWTRRYEDEGVDGLRSRSRLTTRTDTFERAPSGTFGLA